MIPTTEVGELDDGWGEEVQERLDEEELGTLKERDDGRLKAREEVHVHSRVALLSSHTVLSSPVNWEIERKVSEISIEFDLSPDMGDKIFSRENFVFYCIALQSTHTFENLIL